MYRHILLWTISSGSFINCSHNIKRICAPAWLLCNSTQNWTTSSYSNYVMAKACHTDRDGPTPTHCLSVRTIRSSLCDGTLWLSDHSSVVNDSEQGFRITCTSGSAQQPESLIHTQVLKDANVTRLYRSCNVSVFLPVTSLSRSNDAMKHDVWLVYSWKTWF